MAKTTISKQMYQQQIASNKLFYNSNYCPTNQPKCSKCIKPICHQSSLHHQLLQLHPSSTHQISNHHRNSLSSQAISKVVPFTNNVSYHLKALLFILLLSLPTLLVFGDDGDESQNIIIRTSPQQVDKFSFLSDNNSVTTSMEDILFSSQISSDNITSFVDYPELEDFDLQFNISYNESTTSHPNVLLLDNISTISPSTSTWDLIKDNEVDANLSVTLPYSLRATATVACLIVLFFGVTGNILVPLVVCRTRELCTNSTNVFLINLSIADLLILIVCMPTVLIELHSQPEVWTLGEVMCKAVPFVELVVANGSILTILAISFERYYAICKPLKANYKCTMRRAVITICCLWSVALLATIPVLFGTELEQTQYIDGSLVNVCSTKANAVWQKCYFLITMAAFFWMPFFVLIVIYCIIYKRLILDDRRLLRDTLASTHSSINSGGRDSLVNIRSSLACVSTNSGGSISKESSVWPVILWRNGSASAAAAAAAPGSRNGSASGPPATTRPNMAAEKAQMRCRRQVVWMLGAVVACFFTCLLPFRLFTIWLLVVTDEDIQRLSMPGYYSLLYFCRIMLYVNSMLNPFLYAVVSSKFRKAFVETVCQYCCYCNDYCLCFCCCCCSEPDDLLEDFQKGMAPRGKMRRKYRRNRRFLLRQSTFNTTTTTTTTSSSLKNASLNSAPWMQNGAAGQNHPQGTRFSSMDSILTQQNLRAKPPIRHYYKQHSFDLDMSTRGNTRRTPISSKQSSLDSASGSGSSVIINNGEQTQQPETTFSPVHSTVTPQSSLDPPNAPPLDKPTLNTISQYPAEYRRANMMKRSARVAIIDEAEFENEYHNGDHRNGHQNGTTSIISVDPELLKIPRSVSCDDDDQDPPEDPDMIVPNIEDILSDPQFSTYESYV